MLQDGCPRGDGWGGPPWQIRCEINRHRYERGALGMALSGKDTGGSQFFHAPDQPHLNGGYTVSERCYRDTPRADRIVQGAPIRWILRRGMIASRAILRPLGASETGTEGAASRSTQSPRRSRSPQGGRMGASRSLRRVPRSIVLVAAMAPGLLSGPGSLTRAGRPGHRQDPAAGGEFPKRGTVATSARRSSRWTRVPTPNTSAKATRRSTSGSMLKRSIP
ncbi:MAG: peptidylprolyl isomerase [Candidatus Eisenbacteria bacterium]